MPDEARSPELRDYLAVLSQRKWWIVLAMVVVVGAALAFSLSQTPSYTSSSEVLVLPVQVPGPGGGSTDFVNIDQELRIATSPAVAAAANEAVAAKGLTPGDVSISAPSSTNTLVFKASSTDPRAAQATAQAYAGAYLGFRREALLSNVEAATTSIEEVLAKLNAQLGRVEVQATQTNSPSEQQALLLKISALTNQISSQQDLRNQLALSENSPVGESLAHAPLPLSPSSPNPTKAAAIAIFVGLCLGVGMAFLRDRLDQRLRGRSEIEDLVDAPLIGFIPKTASLETRLAVTRGGDPHAGEAFRSLRTRVLFSVHKEHDKTLLVTSPDAGDGKTTTAANLAVALAQGGCRCILVSADLRKPASHRYFPNMNGVGLSDILSGTAQLSEALVQSQIDNLFLLPSGSTPLQPERGLASDPMTNVLKALSQHSDLIILDSAPILGVSDSLELATIVDSVILVADGTRSRRDSVEEAANELLSVGAAIMGVVLTRFNPARFRPYYGYGHPRHYGHEREPEPTREAARVQVDSWSPEGSGSPEPTRQP